MNFLELAFAEDLTKYAVEMNVSVEELANHQADVKELVKLWALVYPDSNRIKVDQKIWDKIQPADIPHDTALILARDIINKHLENESQVRVTASIEDRYYLQPGNLYSGPLAEFWFSVVMEFSNYPFYRLCAKCEKPFQFKHHKATYCSDACRTASFRRTKAIWDEEVFGTRAPSK